MKLFIPIYLVIGFYLQNSFAQEISIYGQRSLWHAENLCDIEFTGCDWRLLNQGSMIGYAYHPSGQFWLVLDERLNGGDYHQINIFEVDISNCQYNLLYSIPLPFYWLCFNAVNIDYKGRLYLSILEYDSINAITTRTLSRITNPAQPSIERIMIFAPNQNIFEVHFSNNNIYIPDLRKEFIYVLDTSFQMLDTLIMEKHIYGLTSFNFGCDSIVTYAAHLNYTTQEHLDGFSDSTVYISEYDLETSVLTPICSYWMGDKRANTQLTSPLEFLSSDPECDLLMDLDRDNSSGVFPYDYLDTAAYCHTVAAPICDEDLYIRTSATLDSIQLTISTVLDPGFEFLSSTSLPAGFSLLQRDDSTYVLLHQHAPDTAYRDAMRSIRYLHTGSQRTAGTRKINVQGFNAVKAGQKITCFINLKKLPNAGIDASLLLCKDTIIQNLSSVLYSQPGGNWQPSLQSGSNQFESQLDLHNMYIYIVKDTVCGADTAILTLTRDSLSNMDILGPDQIICADQSIMLSASINGTSVIWDNGTTVNERLIVIPGTFWVRATTLEGCSLIDTIHIFPGEIWNPVITIIAPTCNFGNGAIIIDSTDFEEALYVFFDQTLLMEHVVPSIGEGTFALRGISGDGCESEYPIVLHQHPQIDITLPDTIFHIPEDTWVTIPFYSLNDVVLADIQFDPPVSIVWENAEIKVIGDIDRTFLLSFIDENGCIDSHIIHTLVQPLPGIYLPTIFRPTSDSGNHLWSVDVGGDYELEMFRIYDRWGNLLYQDITKIEWDGFRNGDICTTGVYVYQINLIHVVTREKKLLKGNLTLIY